MEQSEARPKRDVLGIGDRRKHHTRKATPLRAHARGEGTHHRLYRFRFYPTKEQAEQLTRTFGACRWVYNEGLALRSGAWERHRVKVGFAETCRALTGWRRAEETAWLKEMSSTVLQQSLRHLDHAYQRFFKGQAKYPKRKRKGRSRDTAIYVRTGFSWVEDPERPGTGRIKLAKHAQPLDVRWSRALPAGTVPIRLSVTRDRAGRYFLSTLVEERTTPLPTVFVPGSREPRAVAGGRATTGQGDTDGDQGVGMGWVLVGRIGRSAGADRWAVGRNACGVCGRPTGRSS